jgi:hypothetical protein
MTTKFDCNLKFKVIRERTLTGFDAEYERDLLSGIVKLQGLASLQGTGKKIEMAVMTNYFWVIWDRGWMKV